MKSWTVPAVIGALLAGVLIGRTTSPKIAKPGIAGPDPMTAIPAPTAQSRSASESKSPAEETKAAPGAIGASTKTPRHRIVELLSGHLDLEKLYSALQQAAGKDDPRLQREVFELLRTTDDPALMEELQRLVALRDPRMRRDVLDAFLAEKNPDRRLAWGYVLGAHWRLDDVRPTVLDALEGNDSRLQERMFQQMTLQALPSSAENDRERATARLRLLVSAGPNDALRASAAGALRGVKNSEDIKFLIATMLQDPSSDVQHQAFESLPSNYSGMSGLLEEQTRAMYLAAIDENRTPELRQQAAYRAFHNSAWDDSDPNSSMFLSPQERAVMKAMLDKKR